MMEKSTETAEPSLWKLLKSRLTVVGPPMGLNQAFHMWETVMKVGLYEGTLAVGPGSIPGT